MRQRYCRLCGAALWGARNTLILSVCLLTCAAFGMLGGVVARLLVR